MKLLFHCCCAPCSIYTITKLSKEEGLKIDLLFYNPNIHPQEEYKKRLEGVNTLSKMFNLPLVIDYAYKENLWTKEGKTRCESCYKDRVRRLFEIGKEGGYDLVTTSLLQSPYQNHELLLKLFEECKKEFGLDYLYFDNRLFYRTSLSLAKTAGIYRQKYCGCIVSVKTTQYPT